MAENLFDRITVFFTGDKVFLDGTDFPLGQFTTDVLNLDDKLLAMIDQRVSDFISAVWTLFQEKTDSASSTQERLNAVWDLIYELPVYRNLHLDMETSRNLFPALLSDPGKWAETLDVNSEGRRMFENFLSGLEYFSESLRNFRGQVQGMLELYFEPLSRRNTEAYAQAYTAYFTDMAAAGGLFFPDQEFEQSFPAQICFVPMAHPTEAGKAILAERAEFSYLSHFLYTDFYRGLMAGNAPRRCHNCGRYFLLTAGYNTCYCNSIAPGETERTCRKVGAHRKATHPTGLSPAGMEYRKVYNRLKARKQRGKISADEWNAALSQAQKVLDLAEQGKLSDEEMRKRFAAF